MKASILAIGTELTSGQIPDTNATWISQKLKSHGISVSLHIVAPDDRDLIRQSLRFCEERSNLIFVTGGLGPTSDDFTRDLVSEWARQELVFDESSWNHVQKRMRERGLPVHDFQKQQCFFPQTSQVLTNSKGTANGFCLKARQHRLWCLPGPPREIRAIWNDHIEPQVQEIAKSVDKITTRAWQVLGLGEHQVAHMVEPLIQNSGLEVGYRVHAPYVETKLSCRISQLADKQKYIDQVERQLASFTVARDDEDLAELFCQSLQDEEQVWIEDLVTEGFLLKRLQSFLSAILKRWAFTYSQQVQAAPPLRGVKISCRLQDEFVMQLRITAAGKETQEIKIETPTRSPLMTESHKAYFTEMIFFETLKFYE